MIKTLLPGLALCLLLPSGCERPVAPPRNETPDPPPQRSEGPRPGGPRQAETSFDTPRDREFAQFVARTAGDMVDKVAVGIEKRGQMRVQLGQAADPDDTLPLTKSLLAGARKEFPGQRIEMAIYDPQGAPILRANYHPDRGVDYQVVEDDTASTRPEPTRKPDQVDSQPNEKAGTTDRDRRFAEWAMKTGGQYLRYVQADLDKRGRLWFGVTRTVEPKDVSDLTRSILEGAQNEFPRRDLTATVFDPEGERIGRATLSAGGKFQWSR
jgi:hypothetical protein